MESPQKSHGTRFYIGGNTLALASESSWTQIGGVKGTSGGAGVSYGTTDASSFGDTFKQMAKTMAEAGDLELTMNYLIADAGQVALRAAAANKSNVPYNFKIEVDDDAASVGDNPTKILTKVRVLSFENTIGGVNSLYEAKSKMVSTSGWTETAAAA